MFVTSSQKRFLFKIYEELKAQILGTVKISSNSVALL